MKQPDILDELEHSLDPKIFLSCQPSVYYFLWYYTGVHQWFNGKLKIEINPQENEPIIVSRDKAPLLKEWLGE